MELNAYQQRALETCMPSCDNFSYMMLNLVGEVGELASKIAKHIRKGEMRITDDELTLRESGIYTANLHMYFNATKDYESDNPDDTIEGVNPKLLAELRNAHCAIKGELGDILWQLSGLCHVMGYTLDDIAESNLAKLASRKERGVIDGNGDNR